MKVMQRSIKSITSLSSKGLHTGQEVTVTFKPALANSGIVFKRIDLVNQPEIRVCADNIVKEKTLSRCSALHANGARVMTIEHVMAAIRGLMIDNLIIELNGMEAPGMDGSSQLFVQALEKAGIQEYDVPQQECVITEPLMVSNDHASIMIVPSDDFRINYQLDYPHPLLKDEFQWEFSAEGFKTDIAPSRTFCLANEIELIHQKGLGLGANTTNTVVMGEHGPIDNQLRFSNECSRHKVLDIVGDLYMLGVPIRGAVYANKSGHALNRALVEKIYQQWNMNMLSTQAKRVFDTDAIKNILPHRYPFLFVDKVYEIEQGQRAIGIKNITANENFFQGHFPQKPILPGVVMIEALAQVSGVLMFGSGKHDGKLALFMGIDEAKFRRMVGPGDQLVMEVEVLRDRERTVQLRGTGRVDGEIVVEANIMLSYTDSSILPKI